MSQRVLTLCCQSYNAAEFFVALASSLVFVVSVISLNWTIVLGLAVGGVLSAPFAAYFAKRIPARLFMILIGIMIMLLSVYIIFQISF